MAEKNFARQSDFHLIAGFFNMPQTCDFTSSPKEGMLWNFSPKKSDGFGRDRTRDLGYAIH
jgi:hypothetical protein